MEISRGCRYVIFSYSGTVSPNRHSANNDTEIVRRVARGATRGVHSCRRLSGGLQPRCIGALPCGCHKMAAAGGGGTGEGGGDWRDELRSLVTADETHCRRWKACAALVAAEFPTRDAFHANQDSIESVIKMGLGPELQDCLSHPPPRKGRGVADPPEIALRRVRTQYARHTVASMFRRLEKYAFGEAADVDDSDSPEPAPAPAPAGAAAAPAPRPARATAPPPVDASELDSNVASLEVVKNMIHRELSVVDSDGMSGATVTIIAASGAGKSFLVEALFNRLLAGQWEDVVAVMPAHTKTTYPWATHRAAYSSAFLSEFMTNAEKEVRKGRARRTLLILDDCTVTARDADAKRALSDFSTRCRHVNVTLVIVSHDLKNVLTPTVRRNAHVQLFSVLSRKDYSAICEELVGLRSTKKLFVEWCLANIKQHLFAVTWRNAPSGAPCVQLVNAAAPVGGAGGGGTSGGGADDAIEDDECEDPRTSVLELEEKVVALALTDSPPVTTLPDVAAAIHCLASYTSMRSLAVTKFCIITTNSEEHGVGCTALAEVLEHMGMPIVDDVDSDIVLMSHAMTTNDLRTILFDCVSREARFAILIPAAFLDVRDILEFIIDLQPVSQQHVRMAICPGFMWLCGRMVDGHDIFYAAA